MACDWCILKPLLAEKGSLRPYRSGLPECLLNRASRMAKSEDAFGQQQEHVKMFHEGLVSQRSVTYIKRNYFAGCAIGHSFSTINRLVGKTMF
jgi:hypothetical protein